jgi:hypothetical protein
MRATTSLPDPVGPRMSTEMSDLAAVRIHSKTISIFSSRPIISRKRCTDGDWSSVLIAARRSRNGSSVGTLARSGRAARSAWADRPGGAHAEVHQLLEAVLDVETHAAERGHQRLDVEGFVGLRVQEADEPAASGDCTSARKRASAASGSGRSGGGGALRGKADLVHRDITTCVSAQPRRATAS